MKTCSKCQLSKPLDDFSSHRREKDGKNTICKSCDGIRKRAWQKANPQKCCDSRKRYYQRHPDRVKAYNQSQKGRARDKRYYRRNYQKCYAMVMLRKARLLKAPIVEKIDRISIYERDQGICHICKHRVSKMKFTLDHLIPLSKQGNHTAINLATAHRSCNSRRKDGRLPAQLRLLP